MIYTAGGWARQSEMDGERLTVFDLQLNYLAGRDTPSVALDTGAPRPLCRCAASPFPATDAFDPVRNLVAAFLPRTHRASLYVDRA